MSDIIKNYADYNTSGEFSVWIEKLELVATLQKITDKLAFLPLFLSGPAFSVYQQLSDDTKADYDKLKKELTTAFSTNSFSSYEQLRNRVLSEGELVDVYLADLRRLVNLMGQTVADPLLRCAFVAGLPADISLQLRSSVDVESMELSTLVSKARAMVATRSHYSSYACAAITENRTANLQCYNCSGTGHIARNCPSERKRKSDAQPTQLRKCYVCGSVDHLANRCSQRAAKWKRGSVGVGCSPSTYGIEYTLPIIDSLVNGTKFRSLVDTGCQQSVVSAHALKSISLRYVGCRTTVTMLDGNTTECLGEVDLHLQIGNKMEKLRCLVSTSLVCGCSVIIGMDAIRRFGGLCISAEGIPRFGVECEPLVAAASTHVQCSKLERGDSDFVARSDGDKWTVEENLEDKEPVLQNRCSQYNTFDECRKGHVQEVEEHRESAHGKVCASGCPTSSYSIHAIRDLHDTNHLGVERTLHLARCKWGETANKDDVVRVVSECHVCKRIDPAPARWERGELGVSEPWTRLASDITHFKGISYLTIIDCGPSRFSLWRKLRNETADNVAREIEQVFNERGPPKELLSDNGPCYQSQTMKDLMRKWNVEHIFSCAYRAAGNGIVERHHRTIKRMMARSGGSVQDMVYWYNFSPKADGSVPAGTIYAYDGKSIPDVNGNSFKSRGVSLNPYRPGDVVYVKPPNARCTTPWRMGKVTALVSNTAAKIDSITRHISDLRLCHPSSTARDEASAHEFDIGPGVDSNGDDDNGGDDNGGDVSDDQNQRVGGTDADSEVDGAADREIEIRQSSRERRPPAWLANFYVDD